MPCSITTGMPSRGPFSAISRRTPLARVTVFTTVNSVRIMGQSLVARRHCGRLRFDFSPSRCRTGRPCSVARAAVAGAPASGHRDPALQRQWQRNGGNRCASETGAQSRPPRTRPDVTAAMPRFQLTSLTARSGSGRPPTRRAQAFSATRRPRCVRAPGPRSGAARRRSLRTDRSRPSSRRAIWHRGAWPSAPRRRAAARWAPARC